MNSKDIPGVREKRQIGGELVIPVSALLFTLYYFSTIIDSPWTAQVSAFFVGTVLILLVGIFLVKSAIVWRSGEVELGMDLLSAPRSMLGKRVALFLLTLGFIILVDWGGFTLTTFAFLCLAMLLLSGFRRYKMIVFLSAVLAIGGYFLFIVVFETRYPAGPFENLMKPLIPVLKTWLGEMFPALAKQVF